MKHEPRKSVVISKRQIMSLIESQGFRCALTGRTLEPETAAVDHKIPVSAGGAHDISNLWVIHTDVNRAKNTMLPSAFIAMCRDVVRFTDGTDLVSKVG